MLDMPPKGVRRPTIARFMAKVAPDEETGCWIWTGAIAKDTPEVKRGYGIFWGGEYNEKGQPVMGMAHKWAYEHFVGPVPEGLTLDHTCRRRNCVRPEHLDPVTQRENTMRGIGPSAINAEKTHCLRGHPLSGENLYVPPGGGRRGCRTCRRDWALTHRRPDTRQRGSRRRRG